MDHLIIFAADAARTVRVAAETVELDQGHAVSVTAETGPGGFVPHPVPPPTRSSKKPTQLGVFVPPRLPPVAQVLLPESGSVERVDPARLADLPEGAPMVVELRGSGSLDVGQLESVAVQAGDARRDLIVVLRGPA
jgi:hypothetical protein